jgi:type IX secretion system PorP/SprF family membrane protein
MRKVITTLVLSSIAVVSFAQQDAQFSQFMFNKLDMNPGYSGTDKALCATAIYRDQWVNFPGAPKTGLISLDAYVPQIHGGLGLTVCSDELGFNNTLFAQLAYSYNMVLGTGTLGIGANIGLQQMSLNGTWIATDPVAQDAAIPVGKVSNSAFDLGFGLYYRNDAGMFFGLSSTHLPETSISKNGADGTDVLAGLSSPGNFSYQLIRHYYVMAGYPIPLNPDIKIIPALLAKTDGSTTQVDINARFMWQDKYWFGMSYRIQDAIIFMAGFEYKNFTVGYSFDLTTSALKSYSSDTHEIVLKYCFKPFKTPEPSRHSNVRFVS